MGIKELLAAADRADVRGEHSELSELSAMLNAAKNDGKVDKWEAKGKYALTDETITVDGHILHRIKALYNIGFEGNIGYVAKGTLGGFIEKEANLAHKGTCWVYDDACVYGDAKVCDNACVRGNARVYDNAKICGKTLVTNKAKVYGNAEVCDNAVVKDDAEIFGDAKVRGNVRIGGHQTISSGEILE